MRIGIKTFIVAFLIFSLNPTQGLAKSSFTFTMTIGGTALGGVGIFFYYVSVQEFSSNPGELKHALINVTRGKLGWGLPLVDQPAVPIEEENRPIDNSLVIKVFEWRF